MTQVRTGSGRRRLLCRLVHQNTLAERLPPPASWLSPTEQVRWASFSTDVRRRTFLAGRWLARQTAAEWLGTENLPSLQVAATGACVVADWPTVFVSISHHGAHVACAVADVPVGVDIEGPRPRRDVLALAAMVQGPAQQTALARLPVAERDAVFLEDWTLKEAWLKARQQGLDFALMRSLAFDDIDPTRQTVPPSFDVAVARHGEQVIAVAGVPSLPETLDSEPALHWCRRRSHLSPACAPPY